MDKFVMVPVEPTKEMRAEIMSGINQNHMVKNYKAMLAAAPIPAFDEAAERAAAAEVYNDTVGNGYSWGEFVVGWLACAKRKAGVL